jgi:ankyrin repeat protein
MSVRKKVAKKLPEESSDSQSSNHRPDLRELLEDVFEGHLEMREDQTKDLFSGPDALTIESQIYADEDRPLHVFARHGNAYAVRMLLEAGADPNSKGDLSLSPLYYAIRKGHFEVAKLLLEAGARIDIVNEFGCTDLGSCSPRGSKPNAKMFRLLQSYWPGVMPHDARTRKY